MITREKTKELVDQLGKEFEDKPYNELERIIEQEDGWPAEPELIVDGTTLIFSPNVNKIGGRRERISVEIFVHADGMNKWGWRPGYYFEKYPSGKINRFDKFGWDLVVLFTILIGGSISLLYFLIDWLFL